MDTNDAATTSSDSIGNSTGAVVVTVAADGADWAAEFVAIAATAHPLNSIAHFRDTNVVVVLMLTLQILLS